MSAERNHNLLALRCCLSRDLVPLAPGQVEGHCRICGAAVVTTLADLEVTDSETEWGICCLDCAMLADDDDFEFEGGEDNGTDSPAPPEFEELVQ